MSTEQGQSDRATDEGGMSVPLLLIKDNIQFITPGGESKEGNYKSMLCIQSEAKLLLATPMNH